MNSLAVITGAGSGIGQATACLFSSHQWTVALLGRDAEKLKQTQKMCASTSHVIPCDLSHPPDIDRTILEIKKISAPLHCLVNNAGIYKTQKQVGGDINHWREQFEVNLFGAVSLTQGLLPHFQKNSSIINVASTLGLKTAASTGAYSASKAAMINWTQTLALELGEYGIRANVICPGLVDTPIHEFHQMPSSEKARALSRLNPLQPLGRIGTSEEIAQSIYFLSSRESNWTTGAILTVDGGINLT